MPASNGAAAPLVDPEFAATFPPLEPEVRAGLEASLKAEGCRDALVVWAGHNILLDGHNRLEICRRENIPFETVELEFGSRDEAKIWLIRNQIDRRNLSDIERALIALQKLKPLLEAQARANSLANLKQGPECQIVDSREFTGRVNAQVAKAADMSHEQLRRVELLQARAPEAIAAIKQYKSTIAKEYRNLIEPERRAERMAALIEPGRVQGRFPVIKADPPWRFEFSSSDSREIENHYPTMGLEEICALPVREWALDDCTLFLWAPSAKLIEAARVIEAWGFTYRTSRVWDKGTIGMGYYVREEHEFLLIATKGEPPTPAQADRPPSIIRAPRTSKHSEKPEIAYQDIERMYPQFYEAGLLLELFQRQPRKGWKGWGNEVRPEVHHVGE